MDPTYQHKEDYSPKVQKWIAAAAKAWNIPEEELWEDTFRVARELEVEQSNNSPVETLLSFPIPKSQ